MLQAWLVWVNADTSEDWSGSTLGIEAHGGKEHGTSIVKRCLHCELGRLVEMARLAGLGSWSCLSPEGGRKNFAYRTTQTHLLRWSAP